MVTKEKVGKDFDGVKSELKQTGKNAGEAAYDAAFVASKEKGGEILESAKKLGDEAGKKAGTVMEAIKNKAEEVTGKDLDHDGKVGK